MGRGRAKAKQQKVARDLKYNTPVTDFSKLQEELGRPGGTGPTKPSHDSDEEDDDEDWVSNYN